MKKITIEITDADYFYLQAKYGKVSSVHWAEEVRGAIRKNILDGLPDGDIPKGHEWYVGAMIHDSNFFLGLPDTKAEYEEFNSGFDDPSEYYPVTD